MRNAIVWVLFGNLLISGELRAQHDWRSVTMLMRGSEVTVLQSNGRRLNGRLDSVDDTSVVIIARRPFSLARRPLSEHSVTVLRSAIEQIDWVINRRRLFGFVRLKDDRVMVYRSPQS